MMRNVTLQTRGKVKNEEEVSIGIYRKKRNTWSGTEGNE
jgi:hypothetical protein